MILGNRGAKGGCLSDGEGSYVLEGPFASPPCVVYDDVFLVFDGGYDPRKTPTIWLANATHPICRHKHRPQVRVFADPYFILKRLYAGWKVVTLTVSMMINDISKNMI